MFGDRKPYPVALVTLDAEQIVPWAEATGLPTDVGELAAARSCATDPGRARCGQRQVRPGRADQALRHPDRDFTLEPAS